MREWLERAEAGLDLPPAPEPYPCNLAPFYRCARCGRRDAIERLLEAGWDINEYSSGIVGGLDNPEMLEFLRARGARLDEPDGFGQSILLRAVLANDSEKVKALLASGADPNHADQEGRTALWLAARRNRQRLVECLLEHGADPNLADHEGVVPLMKAGTAAVLRLLLQAGARAEVLDHQGRSLFQHFCRKPEALMRLIEAVPPAQVPVEFRLWHCYQMGNRQAFEKLCLEALPALACDRPVMHSQTVLWWAARLGAVECCERLCAAGWNPRRTDRDGRTALDIAVAADHPRVVGVLLRLGGYNAGDRLPMDLARRRKNPQVIGLLETYGRLLGP